MTSDWLIVIPARMKSTRFPGKVLAPLGGVPVAEWCRRAAVRAELGPVVVATEDARVARALKRHGADVVLTSPRCASGSDRVWEAARKRGGRAARFIMNLQGDEPFISAETVRQVARALSRNSWADISTAVVPMRDGPQVHDPNVVKAALGAVGRCLYFSRTPIPYPRSAEPGPLYWRHIGVYGYRREALKRFIALPPSPLERRESLEQLRALEAGMQIAAAVVKNETVAIDTPEDLRRAERLLTRNAGGKNGTRRARAGGLIHG